MSKHFSIVESILVLVAVLFVFLIAGCPGPQDEGPDGESVNGEQTDNQVQPDEQIEEPVIDEEEARQFRENIGSTGAITQEEIDNLTKFGVFIFPGAELDAENSMKQSFVEGSEIYRLAYGTETDMQVVADWYRDHLEAGFEENERDLVSSVSMIGFYYTVPDNSWWKNITLNGVAGEGKTQIVINLTSIIQPSDEEVAEE